MNARFSVTETIAFSISTAIIPQASGVEESTRQPLGHLAARPSRGYIGRRMHDCSRGTVDFATRRVDAAYDQADDRWAMRKLDMTTVGAICALLTVASFAVGIVFMAGSGVQVLIPQTGKDGLDWIADIDDAGGAFFVGAWLVILGGYLGLVALVGFYFALREAGPVMILGPILGAVGLTLVQVSHLIPIGMAYELVPDYVHATGATQASIASTADTLAILALVVNYTGNLLNWGVVVPLYAIAILKTGALPRWIGWLGLATAATGGWLGLLAPASGVIEGISSIGFFLFFIFLAATGVALLRRRRAEPKATPAAAL
jgi:hypothetical protein